MNSILLALALVVTEPDGTETKLFDTPCVVQRILDRFPHHRLELRAGSLQYKGKVMAACWVAGKQWVFVIDEEGDLSRVAIDRFRELK